ncbi:Transport And Golgi Organization Protein 1-like [Manis pentadactyla]|nr:Transport And Golgi Organization Protein 1-like [Manis pentadactyla]
MILMDIRVDKLLTNDIFMKLSLWAPPLCTQLFPAGGVLRGRSGLGCYPAAGPGAGRGERGAVSQSPHPLWFQPADGPRPTPSPQAGGVASVPWLSRGSGSSLCSQAGPTAGAEPPSWKGEDHTGSTTLGAACLRERPLQLLSV